MLICANIVSLPHCQMQPISVQSRMMDKLSHLSQPWQWTLGQYILLISFSHFCLPLPFSADSPKYHFLSKPFLKKAFHKTPILTGINFSDYLRGELSNVSTLICLFREAKGFLYFADTASNNPDVPFGEFRLKTKPDSYLCNKEADRNALAIRQISTLTCLETVDLSDSHLILSKKNSLLHLFSQFTVYFLSLQLCFLSYFLWPNSYFMWVLLG